MRTNEQIVAAMNQTIVAQMRHHMETDREATIAALDAITQEVPGGTERVRSQKIDWMARLQKLTDDLGVEEGPVYYVARLHHPLYLEPIFQADVSRYCGWKNDQQVSFSEQEACQLAARMAIVALLPKDETTRLYLDTELPLPLQLDRMAFPQIQVIDAMSAFLHTDVPNLFLVVPATMDGLWQAVTLFMANYQTYREPGYHWLSFARETQQDCTLAFQYLRKITAQQEVLYENRDKHKVTLVSGESKRLRVCCFPVWQSKKYRRARSLMLRIYDPQVTWQVCTSSARWDLFRHPKSIWLIECSEISSVWYERMCLVEKTMAIVTTS
jgi:hypothetical protein